MRRGCVAMTNVSHKFKVGQTVDLIPSISRFAANGRYQIVGLRPVDGEVPQYTIRSTQEPHERVIAEGDLILATEMQNDRA